MSNFNPYATGYSPINAVWLGKAASLAYKDGPDIHKVLQTENWEFPNFHFFDKDGTQAFIMGNDDTIVIAFRGTQPNCLRDWMTDFQCALVKREGLPGRVHRGFSNSLDHVWADLLAKVKEFQDAEQPILITGHSLGAALATLAAAKLKAMAIPVNGLYTFGSPRVGDANFVKTYKSFNIPTFRFVNNNDVVTRVAPRTFGYGHLDVFLYFDAAGNVYKNVDIWNRFLETVKGSIDDFLKPGVSFINEHDMGLYQENLLKNIEKYFD